MDTIKKYCKPKTPALTVLGVAVIVVTAMLLSDKLSSAAPKPTLSTPALSCAGSGEDYIDIMVTAGSPTGAPAGFTIQWQTRGDFDQFGWPEDSSCPPDAEGVPTCGESFCRASFSGNAASSTFNLAAGESVIVRIGDLLVENGASTDCPGVGLLCNHDYVFRAFAHATNTHQRSSFSDNVTCSTQECPVVCDPNVKSLEFWRTHSGFCTGEGCQEDAWPESVLGGGMMIGGVSYTAEELEAILLLTPEEGDCPTVLLQQVIVARLNIENGASQEYIDLTTEALAAADGLLGGGEGECESILNALNAALSDFACPE